MYESIKLKPGRTPEIKGEAIPCSSVVIFVGPNNSGKSLVLRELRDEARDGMARTIVGEVTFAAYSQEDIDKIVEVGHRRAQKFRPGADTLVFPSDPSVVELPESILRKVLADPKFGTAEFKRYFNGRVKFLDGASRLGLVNRQQAGDLLVEQFPQFALQVLIRNDSMRADLSGRIHEALGSYFVLDMTMLGSIRAKLSDVPVPHEDFERNFNEEVVNFMTNATPIEYVSDGVKAFCGLMAEAVAGNPEMLLIDEPEAFLHPPLAFKLGKNLSQAVGPNRKQLIASTHSPYFLMGCVQSGAPVTVIRLTYERRKATARVLPGGDLLRLMREPLLRSTNVLSALFYSHVVVTEGDTDRAFYGEINERLLQVGRGVRDCLFLQAQNKQTVCKILHPLRELGIAAATIVDIDVIKDGGQNWTALLKSAFVPATVIDGLNTMRLKVLASFNDSGKDMKKDGGVAILTGQAREAALHLFSQLASYGVFVVPGGEVESWLSSVRLRAGIPSGAHGGSWLSPIFEAMGSDPTSSEYVRPSEDDVWRFLENVGAWLADPERVGIPE